MTEIIECGWGVANVIRGKIYINRSLSKHKSLYEKILAHEKKHINDPYNMKIDLFDSPPAELTDWMLKNPSSWIQISPVLFLGGRLVYCKMMILYWAFVFGLLMFGGVVIWTLL